MDKYDIRQLREMLELGQAVAREILSESSYSGRAATYWNDESRFREACERLAENGNE